jgi:hypothetical protein
MPPDALHGNAADSAERPPGGSRQRTRILAEEVPRRRLRTVHAIAELGDVHV